MLTEGVCDNTLKLSLLKQSVEPCRPAQRLIKYCLHYDEAMNKLDQEYWSSVVQIPRCLARIYRLDVAGNREQESHIISSFQNSVEEIKSLDTTNAHLNGTLVAFMTSRLLLTTAEQWEEQLMACPTADEKDQFQKFLLFLTRIRQRYSKLVAVRELGSLVRGQFPNTTRLSANALTFKPQGVSQGPVLQDLTEDPPDWL